MIEVFKTSVEDGFLAATLINRLQNTFPDCEVNFDLEDCDNILRVKCLGSKVPSGDIIQMLNAFGCWAEVLHDKIPQPEVPSALKAKFLFH